MDDQLVAGASGLCSLAGSASTPVSGSVSQVPWGWCRAEQNGGPRTHWKVMGPHPPEASVADPLPPFAASRLDQRLQGECRGPSLGPSSPLVCTSLYLAVPSLTDTFAKPFSHPRVLPAPTYCLVWSLSLFSLFLSSSFPPDGIRGREG